MTCTDFLSQLTDYFDGQIDPKLLAEVQAHICECRHCEVVLDTTRQTISIYREQEVYEFPTELRDRLHLAIMKKCLASGKRPGICGGESSSENKVAKG